MRRARLTLSHCNAAESMNLTSVAGHLCMLQGTSNTSSLNIICEVSAMYVLHSSKCLHVTLESPRFHCNIIDHMRKLRNCLTLPPATNSLQNGMLGGSLPSLPLTSHACSPPCVRLEMQYCSPCIAHVLDSSWSFASPTALPLSSG